MSQHHSGGHVGVLDAIIEGQLYLGNVGQARSHPLMEAFGNFIFSSSSSKYILSIKSFLID